MKHRKLAIEEAAVKDKVPKVNMKAISQVSDVEVPALSDDDVLTSYRPYESVTEGEPLQDEEPTEDDMGAVQHLLHNNKAPYAYFAVLRPRLQRNVKALFLMGTIMVANGGWRHVEQKGLHP